MESLEKCLKCAREGMDIWGGPVLKSEPVPARNIIKATDGVFSMNGDIANLQEIVRLANEYDTLVMVDDSYATGFFGKTGRGSIEYCGVMGKITYRSEEL